MHFWALAFLAIAVIAGLFAFGGIASVSAGTAKILCFVFGALFVAAVTMRLVRRH